MRYALCLLADLMTDWHRACVDWHRERAQRWQDRKWQALRG